MTDNFVFDFAVVLGLVFAFALIRRAVLAMTEKPEQVFERDDAVYRENELSCLVLESGLARRRRGFKPAAARLSALSSYHFRGSGMSPPTPAEHFPSERIGLLFFRPVARHAQSPSILFDIRASRLRQKPNVSGDVTGAIPDANL
jgi:hypothetical protein